MPEREVLTVLVVGAGRFGSHYLKILSRLNQDRIPGLPEIDTLVLTRTRSESAGAAARHLSSDPACAVRRVVGLRVADKTDLQKALQQHRPALTCIVASDPLIGDAVHAAYSDLASGFGPVLCEKPFSPSTGDGRSLALLYRMKDRPGSDRFGLELPMVPVRLCLEKNIQWSSQLLSAGQVSFLWSTQTPLQRSDLIDTLALHPWSLIPPDLSPRSLQAEISNHQVRIRGELAHRQENPACLLSIILQTESRTRAVGLDDRLFVFRTEGSRVTVSEHPGPLPQNPEASCPTGGRLLLEVDNPLKTNIVASLQGRPLTGLPETLASQEFLEGVRGWKAEKNEKRLAPPCRSD